MMSLIVQFGRLTVLAGAILTATSPDMQWKPSSELLSMHTHAVYDSDCISFITLSLCSLVSMLTAMQLEVGVQF